MPTIEEKLTQMLIDRGMFEDMAAKVIQQVKDDDGVMQERWHDSIEGYPDTLVPVLWLTVHDTAREWIDENIPQAWFRPMFAKTIDDETD